MITVFPQPALWEGCIVCTTYKNQLSNDCSTQAFPSAGIVMSEVQKWKPAPKLERAQSGNLESGASEGERAIEAASINHTLWHDTKHTNLPLAITKHRYMCVILSSVYL